MTRRRYGHGSLSQRKDGRWVGRLPDGRGGHRYFTGMDRADVERRMGEARRLRDQTTSSSSRGGERVAALMERYLSTTAPLRNRPRTLEGHRQVVRDHIAPVMGDVRVTQLEVRDVQRMVDRMTGRGYSPKTIQNTVNVLSAGLRQAMREESVARNVAGLATIPRVTRPKLPSLSTDEVYAFLEATRGEPLWPVWVLAGTMGLRVSEILGLLWRDVDLDAGTLAVTGQYRRSRREDGAVMWNREEPKTEHSVATLYIPAIAREALAVAKARQSSTKLVFPGRGGYPRGRRYIGRAFHAALARHGFNPVRLHSLRHSFVVAVLDETAGDLRAAQAVARHGSISVTVDRYGREADAARKRAAEATDRAMARRRA